MSIISITNIDFHILIITKRQTPSSAEACNDFTTTFTEVNFIWAFHQVHHTPEDFNIFTGARLPSFNRQIAIVSIICVLIKYIINNLAVVLNKLINSDC